MEEIELRDLETIFAQVEDPRVERRKGICNMEQPNLSGELVYSYHVLEEIGSGGFGKVYRGEHTVLHTVVAIKFLHTAFSSVQEQEQFFAEARLLGELKHTHILQVLDAGLHTGIPFLVTTYAPGGSLRQRLAQKHGQPLPVDEAVQILIQVGEALQYAHQQSIVHRDLKPDNILFNESGEPLLADFGLAVTLTSLSTSNINKAGTPAYMAPEQFDGYVSFRSDQYALACMAYELLTGRRPFVAPNLLALAYQQKFTEPDAPTQLNPKLPLYIEGALLKAMKKQREERYVDVAAFLRALQTPVESAASQKDREPVLEARSSSREALSYFQQGSALLGQQRHMEAAAAFGQALRFDPHLAAAYYLRAQALFTPGKYQEALEDLEHMAQLMPNFAPLYYAMAASLEKQGRINESLQMYDRVLGINPGDKQAYALKTYHLMQLGHYEEALATLKQWQRVDPEAEGIYTDTGTVLEKLGHHEEARKAYKEAQKRSSGSADSYYNEGIRLFQRGRYAEALVANEQALLLNPQHAMAYTNMATILDELQRSDEALQAYDRALEINPQLIEAVISKTVVLQRLERNNEALATLQQALQVHPLHAELYFNQAVVQGNLGHYTEALASYERVLELDPQHISACCNRGATLNLLGRQQEALEAYEQALRLNPDLAVAYNNKGRLLKTLHRYQQALEAYEQALRLNPDMLEAILGRAEVLKIVQEAHEK